jgi:excinuclease ABC subunit A
VGTDRQPHCHICGLPIVGQSAEQIIDQVMELPEGTRFMVLAPIVRGRKGEYGKQLEELRGGGLQRVKVDGELRRLDEEIELDKKFKHDIAVVVDRLVMKARPAQAAGRLDRDGGRARRRAGRDRAGRQRRDPDLQREVRVPDPRAEPGRARAADLQLQRAARRLPALHGLGSQMEIDPDLVVPDPRCRSARGRSRRGR